MFTALPDFCLHDGAGKHLKTPREHVNFLPTSMPFESVTFDENNHVLMLAKKLLAKSAERSA